MSAHLKRLWGIGIILAVCIIALVCRLIDLSIVNQYFLKRQCEERTIRKVVIPSYRGIIADRNGAPLAISTPVYALWIDPKKPDFSPSPQEWAKLSCLINVPVSHLQLLVNKNKKRQFVYLKRDLPPNIFALIKALNIKGLYLEKQYRRFYPDGAASSHLIGFTNIDDHGQEGLELLYNHWLEGQPGLRKVLRDRYGQEVENLELAKAAEPGHNLILSIDARIQYIAYHELLNGVKNFGAESGAIVVLNIHTGEILAMANVPSFNPNARLFEKNGSRRNRAVTDLFEPGSTLKTFAMAAALASGKYHPGSLINTHPGYWFVNGKKIDDDGHDEGVIDLTTILQKSSNVGMSKIMLSLPPDLFLSLLHQLGFSLMTGTGFPGESPGLINKSALRSPFVYATLSFGYGISVNLLQLAHAYATLANDGRMVPLTFIKRPADDQNIQVQHKQTPTGIQVISPKIASQVREMLEYVLKQGGTAKAARIYDYRVTGKTGTTRILGPHGYEKKRHNSIFVGIAPVSHPELVVAVMIHAPTKKAYFGGDVAGPVFSKVMGDSLRILNVAPDIDPPSH